MNNNSSMILSDQEQEDDSNNLDGIEEIAQEITSGKKKVIKKKIIKKIIKRKNPDGTEAPPEVHTTIIERETTNTETITGSAVVPKSQVEVS
jgi:hypothetical protein